MGEQITYFIVSVFNFIQFSKVKSLKKNTMKSIIYKKQNMYNLSL